MWVLLSVPIWMVCCYIWYRNGQSNMRIRLLRLLIKYHEECTEALDQLPLPPTDPEERNAALLGLILKQFDVYDQTLGKL